MKKILLFSCLISFIGCTKTKTKIVTITKNDTITINNQNIVYTGNENLFGKWYGVSDTLLIDSFYIKDNGISYRYISNFDSIYNYFYDQSIFGKYGYYISSDTLFLYPKLTSYQLLYFIKQN